MPFATFGPGIAIVTRTDIDLGTPVNIGYAQELSLDLAGESKQLYGQNQLPLVIARGTIKATGKLKAAMINPLAYNSVFWGQNLQTGGYSWNIGEAHTVPAGGGTITVAQGATFDADLGVVYASTQIPLQRTSVAPTLGNYSIGALGTYAFASIDENKGVNFTYTNSITIGQSLVVNNPLIGNTPSFRLDYWTNLNQPQAKPFAVRVFYCVADKTTNSFKLTDFMMPEFDFSFGQLPDGRVFQHVYPNGV